MQKLKLKPKPIHWAAAVTVAALAVYFTLIHLAGAVQGGIGGAKTGGVAGVVQGAVRGAVTGPVPAAKTYTLYFDEGVYPLHVSILDPLSVPNGGVVTPVSVTLDPGGHCTFTAHQGTQVDVRAATEKPPYQEDMSSVGPNWSCQYTIRPGTEIPQKGDRGNWDGVSASQPAKSYIVGTPEFLRLTGEGNYRCTKVLER